MEGRTPEQRLEAIRNAPKHTKADPSHHNFQNLAAGPLEDLLSEHGAALIERVEHEAPTNPAFNLLLGAFGRAACLRTSGLALRRRG